MYELAKVQSAPDVGQDGAPLAKVISLTAA